MHRLAVIRRVWCVSDESQEGWYGVRRKAVESSLRDYGLDVQALENAIRSMLETFKMGYDPALDDPLSGKIVSFITEEGKKTSALIPKQDRDLALQIWRSDCDSRRPREEKETKHGI